MHDHFQQRYGRNPYVLEVVHVVAPGAFCILILLRLCGKGVEGITLGGD